MAILNGLFSLDSLDMLPRLIILYFREIFKNIAYEHGFLFFENYRGSSNKIYNHMWDKFGRIKVP